VLAGGLLLSLLAAPTLSQHGQAVGAANSSRTPSPIFALSPLRPQRVHLRQHPLAVDAIRAGLHWLADHQSEDGRWDADEFMQEDDIGPGKATHDVAMTGLALLACAREGRLQAKEDDYRMVLAGVRWLADQQQGSGLLGAQASHDFIYDHAIGTLGRLAATAATSSVAARDAAERALGYLDAHRNPYAVWRYSPRDGDNDTSVTTWCVLACAGGFELGFPIDDHLLPSLERWLDKVTDEQGRTGYAARGGPSSRKSGPHSTQFPPGLCETLTGAGLLCRAIFGLTEGEPTASLATELLALKPPKWETSGGHVDYCYWFFAAEALRHTGGDATTTWRKHLVAAVAEGQHKDGRFAGAWDPVGPWGEEGGRIYATAMAVIALQSLYPLEQD